jgi:hypothetical protein
MSDEKKYTMYVLRWRVVSTGQTGRGSLLPLTAANELLAHMRAKNDGKVYWLEVWQ